MQIKQKDAGQFIGRSIEIAGKGIHDEKYSQEKNSILSRII